jgi:hypothetical protein
MTDSDKEDEINKIKGPGYGMPHSCLTKTPVVLPAEGEERPEKNNRKKANGYQKRPSHLA